jgi:hypothetical protein
MDQIKTIKGAGMQLRNVVCGLGLALCAGPAFSEVYIGGMVTSADRDYDDISRSTGGQFLAGYRFEQLPLMIEAGYTDTGDADIDVLPGASTRASMNYSGLQLTIGGFAKLSDLGSGAWLKAGFYSGNTEMKIPVGSFPDDLSLSGKAKDSSSGGVLGIGGVWKLTPWFGLRAEFSTLLGVAAFASDEDINLMSAGVIFEFPAVKAAPARTFAPQAVARSMPPPLPAAASVAAAPSQSLSPSASGTTLMLSRQASLRGQPKMSGVIRATLPAGSTVSRKSRMDNADGGWWFVDHQGMSGWLNDQDTAN